MKVTMRHDTPFENTAAEAAGAPCFDVCQLNRLARRLMSAYVVLIGRNDSFCSFEECASLALKMRDLDATCYVSPHSGSKVTVSRRN